MGQTAAKPNAEFPDKRASVTCKCGKAALYVRDYAAKYRIECACFSCRQRQEWANAMQCPGVSEYDAPSDLTWLDNAICKVDGAELLQTRVLRDGSDTRWLASTCCNSVVAVSNPLYKGNVFAVGRSCVDLDIDDMQPQARIQTGAWSKKRVGEG
jgi:hypothetical protein